MKRTGILISLVIISALAGLIFSGLFSNPGAASLNFSQGLPNVFGGFSRTEDQHHVRKVIGSYLNAWQAGNSEEMYSYLSSLDKTRVSLADYTTQFGQFLVKPLKYYIKKVTYPKDSTAMVTLQVFWPNVDEDAAISKEESFILVREGAEWKIREDISLLN